MPKIERIERLIHNIIVKINNIRTDLLALSRRLPDHLLPRQLTKLFDQLNRFFENPKEIINLPEDKVAEILRQINESRAKIKDFLIHNQEDPQASRLLDKILRDLNGLDRELKKELKMQENTPDATRPASPILPPTGEGIFQVSPAIESPRDLRIELSIPFERVAGNEAARGEPSKKARLTESLKVESFSRILELFGRFLSARVLERTGHEAARETGRTENAVRDVLERTLRELKPSVEPIEYKVIFDQNQKAVRIEIAGRYRESELVKITREIVRQKPAEFIPLLAEAALKTVERDPRSTAEVSRFLTQTVASALEIDHAPARDINPVAVREVSRATTETLKVEKLPDAVSIVLDSYKKIEMFSAAAAWSLVGKLDKPAESKPLELKPSSPPIATGAETKSAAPANPAEAAEMVMTQIIRLLINEPESSRLPSANEEVPVTLGREERLQIAQSIIQKAPQTALPVLLKEHAQANSVGNQAVKEVVASFILQLAQTKEGRKYILKAVSENPGNPLLASEPAQKVIRSIAQDMLAKSDARPVVGPKSLPRLSGENQLLAIIKLIAKENPALINPEQLTPAAAQQLLELAVKTQQVFEAAGLTNVKGKKATPARNTAYPSLARAIQRAAQYPIKAVSPEKIVTVLKTREAAQELLKLIEPTNEIILPTAILQTLSAGMAMLNIGRIPAKIDSPMELPPESRAASVLRRIVEVLGAQQERINATRPIWLAPRVDSVGEKVLKLTPLKEVVGIIVRFLGVKELEIQKVMDELKRRRKQEELIALLKSDKEGKFETVTIEICDAIGALRQQGSPEMPLLAAV
jgi:hypothetical protein